MRGAGKILDKLKPNSLLEYWTVLVFLIAVIQLFILAGADIRALILFLLPPLIALLLEKYSESRSTRIVAMLFLSSISFGVALSPLKNLFPNLGGVFSQLSRKNDRILTWYLLIYIIYMTGVMPIFVFVRSLLYRRRGIPTEFGRFTCIFGLTACTIITPAMLWVSIEHMGLFPVYKQASGTNYITESDK